MPDHNAHIMRAHQDRLHIVSAALKFGVLTISLPAPHRHHDLIRMVVDAEFTTMVMAEQQGFIDSWGFFRNREQAKHIARDAGQLLPEASPNKHLFTEDLW